MKNIALIGSTGSIGRQVIDCVSRLEGYRICSLVANEPSELFDKQVEDLKPDSFALASKDRQKALETARGEGADIVFNAAAGFAGLEYSLNALSAGKTLALANKETLVCGGQLVLDVAAKTGADIIPVDSEHSAIWQCMGYDRAAKVKSLIITASGGPFRGYSQKKLEGVTAEEALNHPTWQMGKKITVDSATMANKGYEVIEAHILYGVPYERITAVIQPGSIVHSLVEFDDGAVLAQMSNPTMELPIQLALTYPERKPSGVAPMDFKKALSLRFLPIERGEYPLFDLALDCGKRGGIYPLVFNAADEAAVWAFLRGRIKFTEIFTVVNAVLQGDLKGDYSSLEGLKNADLSARDAAEKFINSLHT